MYPDIFEVNALFIKNDVCSITILLMLLRNKNNNIIIKRNFHTPYLIIHPQGYDPILLEGFDLQQELEFEVKEEA